MDEMQWITHKIQIDQADDRDYLFDDLCGNIHLEKITTIPKFTIRKQVGNPCTRYGLYHLNNCQNLIEYGKAGKEYKEIDPIIPRNEWSKDHPDVIREWDTLQNAMKQWKWRWDIAWYTKISNTKESMIKAVQYGFFVYTAMQRLDRSRTRDTWIVVPARDYCFWHCIFWAKEYNEDAPELTGKGIRFANSFWPERGKYKWWFFATREYLLEHDPCSKYAIIDTDNKLVSNFKEMEKKAKLKALYDATVKAIPLMSQQIHAIDLEKQLRENWYNN